MKSANKSSYDLSSLANSDRELIDQCMDGIRDLVQDNVQSIICIGRNLCTVKDKMSHGQFGRWLSVEFSGSYSTATKMMQAYRRFGSSDIDLSRYRISVSALYRLSSPSIPDSAVDQVFKRSEQGGNVITVAFAGQVINGSRLGMGAGHVADQ